MNRTDAYRMIRRRTADAGFAIRLGCHTFRATGITAYLEAGGTPVEVARLEVSTKAHRNAAGVAPMKEPIPGQQPDPEGTRCRPESCA